MASERRRIAALAGLVVLSLLPLLPLVAVAAPAAAPPDGRGQPWWQRVAFTGRHVTGLQIDGGKLVVHLDGDRRMLSADGGTTFVQLPEGGLQGPGATCPMGLRSPQPMLQCAAPAGLPGVLLSVDAGGEVWRRTTAGSWSRALVLLPQGGLRPAPRVTALTAFTGGGISDTVYLGTDGYSVLETTDAGDDWLRGGPGLPDRVLALVADSRRQTLYAGTVDGLWKHRLQALPEPPRYVEADLRARRLATAVVTLFAAACGLAGLRALLGRPLDSSNG